MKKLKASTIIETIVAMTIIMISFGVVVALIIGNSRNSSRLRLNAYLLCEDIKSETKMLNTYINEDFEYENLVIYKSVLGYNESKDIKELQIEAYTKDNKLLYQSKELVNVNVR